MTKKARFVRVYVSWLLYHLDADWLTGDTLEADDVDRHVQMSRLALDCARESALVGVHRGRRFVLRFWCVNQSTINQT